MEILLQKGEMLILDQQCCGRVVQCGEGKLWITQEGDQRDHLLQCGKCFESTLAGRIVITALADSRLTLVQNTLPTANWNICSLQLGLGR